MVGSVWALASAADQGALGTEEQEQANKLLCWHAGKPTHVVANSLASVNVSSMDRGGGGGRGTVKNRLSLKRPADGWSSAAERLRLAVPICQPPGQYLPVTSSFLLDALSYRLVRLGIDLIDRDGSNLVLASNRGQICGGLTSDCTYSSQLGLNPPWMNGAAQGMRKRAPQQVSFCMAVTFGNIKMKACINDS